MNHSNAVTEQTKSHWHELGLETYGKIINIFMGMSLATIGFVANLLLKDGFYFRSQISKYFILIGSLFIVVCLVVLIFQQFARFMYIVNKWMSDNSDHSKLANSVFSFLLSCCLFAFGELLIISGIFFQLSNVFNT